MSEVTTVTLAEEAATEEAACEAIVDQGFVPSAPLSAEPAAYAAGTTYGKGTVVKEGTKFYRSQAAANKGHKPDADSDFEWWAPVGITLYQLQNPAYNATSTPVPSTGRKEPA